MQISCNACYGKPIGKLNAMINFAGVHWAGPLHGASAEDYNNALQLKVVGLHRCAIHAIPCLRKEPNSAVISLSSGAGGENFIGTFLGAYNVSNHAVCMWNDNMMIEERILYATGAVNNPITFTAVEPQTILSTIGTYVIYTPSSCQSIDKTFTELTHIVLSAAQSGLGGPIGLPPVDQSFVAEDIFKILVAPQPGLRYTLGDPDTLIPTSLGSVNFAQLTQILNAISQDDAINALLDSQIPVLGSTATMEFLRQGAQEIYCGNSSSMARENGKAAKPPFYKASEPKPVFNSRHQLKAAAASRQLSCWGQLWPQHPSYKAKKYSPKRVQRTCLFAASA